MRPRDLEATYAGGPAVRSSAAEDGRAAAARRAPLEGVEKSLPAPSTARTRRSGTPACFAHVPHRRIAGRAGYRS
jgi:hypothetical protein